MMLTVMPLVLLALCSFGAARPVPRKEVDKCTPFKTNFKAGSVADQNATSPATAGAFFVATSPPGTFTTGTDGDSLVLRMQRPEGEVKRIPPAEGVSGPGTNDKLGLGATVNMTALLQYGAITFEVKAPKVAGLVTAVVLVGHDNGDEIDVEILGSDTKRFSTNMFATPAGEQPIYGQFGDIKDLKTPAGDKDIGEFHKYTIDWSPERIVWSVDGRKGEHIKRRLKKDSDDSKAKDGKSYYPTKPMRVQMGIWDASGNSGSAEWAGGLVDWSKVGKEEVRAVVKGITIECAGTD